MTIYFHHLRSNKTLLFIEEKPFFNKIRSTTNVISLSCHFHEFNKVHFKQNMFTIYYNKYLELSYCLMKLSHFSCQQLISPEIVAQLTIFLMWFLIYLFCYVWSRRCAVSHNTHAFPLHYYCQYLYLNETNICCHVNRFNSGATSLSSLF